MYINFQTRTYTNGFICAHTILNKYSLKNKCLSNHTHAYLHTYILPTYIYARTHIHTIVNNYHVIIYTHTHQYTHTHTCVRTIIQVMSITHLGISSMTLCAAIRCVRFFSADSEMHIVLILGEQ